MAVAPANLRPALLFSAFIAVLRLASAMTEAEALINFKGALSNPQALKTWMPNSVPCKDGAEWEGVICNRGGFVSGIRLEGMGLSGKIDVNPLLEIKGLRTFSVINNSFAGSIPEVNRIGFLRALYLSGNRFSGEIPSDFFQKMRSLKKLWLSYNNFEGPIPSQIPPLVEFHLENNQFSGNIANLSRTSSLMQFNVSNNKLEGEIPPSLSKFSESSFSGNSGLCGEQLGKPCEKVVEPPQPMENIAQDNNNGDASDSNSNSNSISNSNSSPSSNSNSNSNSKSSSKSSSSTMKVVAITVAATVVVLMLIVLLFVKSRQKKKGEQILSSVRSERNNEEGAVEVQVAASAKKEEGGVTTLSRKSSHTGSSKRGSKGGVGELMVLNEEKGVFGMLDLMRAAAEVLGNGGFGSSYKATMANGVALVVKRMREMNVLGRDGFDAEMRRLGSLRHRNILTPLAYHYRKDEKLVVSEYVPRGSLLYLLHGDRGLSHAELDWPARLKIVQGIAEGMLYLHEELASSVLPHGNLKSSNILLGSDNEPKISDYGFTPLISSANLTQAQFAYKTPEASQGHVSPKSDVYCLGVIILEILSGKFPSQYLNNGSGGIDVVQWAYSAISEGRITEMLDPQLPSSKYSLAEMERLLHIGVACTTNNPMQRLDMVEAYRRIKEIQTEGGSPAQDDQSQRSFGSSSTGSKSGHQDNDISDSGIS